MKKSTVVTITILAIFCVGAVVVFAMGTSDEPKTTPEQSTSQQPETREPATSTPAAGGDTSTAATDEVEIEDFAFTPASITVKKGTTVTWTNKDEAQHNVIPSEDYGSAFQPGGLLSKGQSQELTFNTPGTYKYHCGPHPQMTATVTVTE